MSAPSIDEKAVFNIARRIESSEARAEYVQQACGADSHALRRVLELLQANEQEQSFLESPAVGVQASTDPPAIEKPGAQIGPYKLLEQIGEGGFGVVYMAEQTEPVRRKVALKVLKPGMDTRQIVARFEAERQALALMDHPNIARVFDGGTTPSGRPYFVMELVKGAPITDYCDQHRLTPRQRLELFVSVCQAVQHAHQKGVIHRDIKPTNVLVTVHDTEPVVKVIDFGVAKALGQELTDKTLFTGFAQMVGTPLYMSPEQAGQSGLDIDTRSDIYSLGVLLYELLTGTTPFERSRFQQATYDEIRRIIREEEPPKPSTRLSSQHAPRAVVPSSRHTPNADPGNGTRSVPTTSLASIAAVRNTEPAKLTKLIRGELDWIVMKALEKDRNRRYETASSFAADVQRYRNDEAVQACPPSAWYRFRKFVRRNKQAVWAASLIVLALIVAVIGTTWSWIREQQHSQALQAAHQRERLLNERARQAIETVASDQAIDQLTREKELRPEQADFLAKMIQYYAESAQGEAATEQERSRQARAYHRMGRMNQILGRSQDSENAYRRAVAIGRQLAADFPTQAEFRHDLAHSHNALGRLLNNTGRPMEAEAAYVEGLTILKHLAADFPARPEFRQALAGIYNNLGNLFHETARPKEAEEAQVEALAIRTELAADFPAQPNIRRALAMSHNNLGWLFQSTGRLPEAEAALRDAVAFQKQHVAEFPNQPEFRLELAKYLFNLGHVLRDTARPKEAEEAHAEAVTIFKQLTTEFPNRPEFRQELSERGLQEGGRGAGEEGEEERTSGAFDSFDFP